VPDEWVAVSLRKRRLALYRSRVRWALAIVVVLAGVTGGLMAAMTTSPPRPRSLPSVKATPRYDAGGWIFAANFPAAPSVTRLPTSLSGKRYTTTFYSAVSVKFDMVVGVYPFPIGKPTTSALTFLRHAVTRPRHSPVSVRLRPGTSTTVQGFPSVWLAPTSDGRNTTSYGVIVLDGHVAYEIVVKGPSSTADASFRLALRTFRIVNPSRAVVAL
jgi:hypothetical protein